MIFCKLIYWINNQLHHRIPVFLPYLSVFHRVQTGTDTNDSVMALLYNEEEYTWKVKRPLSGSHIGIRILLPQIQIPMGSGYVPLLTDQ